MEETTDVNPESSQEEVTEEFDQPEEVEETPEESTPEVDAKTVPYERLQEKVKEANALKKELETLKKQPVKTVNKALDVGDYIDISASLEGLDQKEKEYLAEQHKLSGKPLSDIREDENFRLWQSAYQQKVEKEKALEPSNKQMEGDKPRSLDDKLSGASLSEKEKILVQLGLYKSPRPKSDRSKIGDQ